MGTEEYVGSLLGIVQQLSESNRIESVARSGVYSLDAYTQTPSEQVQVQCGECCR